MESSCVWDNCMEGDLTEKISMGTTGLWSWWALLLSDQFGFGGGEVRDDGGSREARRRTNPTKEILKEIRLRIDFERFFCVCTPEILMYIRIQG